MKIFISADIEGSCGIVDWEETNINYESCMYHRLQMSEEVNSACIAANECGYEYILVKDAHSSARNIIPSKLPENTSILRGWTGSPLGMMDGLNGEFDAIIFIGYHSGATVGGNPLSHTKNQEVIEYIKINDKLANEFTINSYVGAYYSVPVVFLSGDEMLCNSVKDLNKEIKTVAVSRGIGNGSISINPSLATKNIYSEVKKALSQDLDKYMIKLPDNFKVEIRFKNHSKAYKASFYPGALLKDSQTVLFSSSDYIEVLKLFLFTI